MPEEGNGLGSGCKSLCRLVDLGVVGGVHHGIMVPGRREFPNVGCWMCLIVSS